MADEPVEGTTEETQDKDVKSDEATGFDAIVAEDDAVSSTSETAGEETQTEEVTEDESAPEAELISEDQFAEAGKVGISRSQAESLGVDGLPRVMRKLVVPDSAQTSDAPAVRDAAPEDVPGKQADVALDPDLLDADLIRKIEGMESTSAKQIGQLQDRLHKLTVEAELRDERESKARFDGMIQNLEGFDKEFGATIPTRTQQANRNQIRTEMDVQRSGRELHGLPVLSDDQLLQRALAGEYSNKAQQLAREQIASTLTKRSKKMISPPTQTKGPKRSNKQQALIAVRAKLEQMGRATDGGLSQENELEVFGT